MQEVYFEVPYEGGFKSGVERFDNIDDALKSAKSSYGDIYMITSEKIVEKHQPIGALLETLNNNKKKENECQQKKV